MLSDRRESFAQSVASSASSAHEAYEKSYGPKAAHVIDAAASRLLRNVKVAARIAQIKAQNAAAMRVSVESVTKMLVDTYHMAQQEKQASAAVQAAMGIGKLHGLIIDRAQIDAVIRKPSASPESPDEMSADDWMHDFAGPTITLPSPTSSN